MNRKTVKYGKYGIEVDIESSVRINISDVQTSFEILNQIPEELLAFLRDSVLDIQNGFSVEHADILDFFLNENLMTNRKKQFNDPVQYDFMNNCVVRVSDEEVHVLAGPMDMYEAYDFISKYYPRDIKNHVRDMISMSLCDGVFDFDKYAAVGEKWDECLEKFRKQRTVMPAMEKMTKVCQTDFVDDGVGFDRVGLDLVVGEFFGVVPRYVRRTVREEIHSKVAYVNAIRLNGKNDYGLIDEAASKYPELVVEMMIDPKVPEYTGIVLGKSRPHNLHVIVKMGVGGRKLREEFFKIFPSVFRKNVERNRQLLGLEKCSVKRYLKVPVDLVVMKSVRWIPLGCKSVKNFKSRGAFVFEKRKMEIQKKFIDICMDPNAVTRMREGKWDSFNFPWRPKGYVLMNYYEDFSPEVLFATVHDLAVKFGGCLVYTPRGWKVKY